MQTHQHSATRPQRLGHQDFNRVWLLPLLIQLLAGPCLFAANQFERVLQPGWTNRSCYSWSVAWGDYDGDGYPDLHVCNTATSGEPYVGFVYRNNGATTSAGPFTQMTTNEVGEVAGDVAISYCSAWIDVNNDGLIDLAVCRSPRNATSGSVSNRVYVNQGNGKLVSVPADALTRPSFASIGTWGDFNNDGWLDFHQLSAYVTDPAAWPIIRTNRLFMGKTDLRFEEITDSVVCTSQTDYANSSSWSDYDNDGDLDLVVVNGSYRTFWFQNQGNGNFVRLTNAITRMTTKLSNAAWGDYDNDGDLDVLISGNQSFLFRNDFPSDFVNVRSFGGAGYPAWTDCDNDGLLDFVVLQGQSSVLQNRLYHNDGNGTFTSVSDPVTTAGRWLVGAWADYDNDGFMDLFVSSAIGANALYHNLGSTNYWIKFWLKGTASNGAAIGAKVRVKATIRGQTVWQMREISGGAWPQDDLRPNFGLSDATNVDLVRIEWPSGIVQTLTNIAPGQILTVVEHQEYSGPLPAFAGATTAANGLQFSIVEPGAGAVYALEGSTNLVNWTKLMARTSAGGTFAYTDSRMTNYVQRFYRVVVP